MVPVRFSSIGLFFKSRFGRFLFFPAVDVPVVKVLLAVTTVVVVVVVVLVVEW